jgi:hypothetical protein
MKDDKEEEELEFLEHVKEEGIREPRISLTTHYLNSLNLGNRPSLILEKKSVEIPSFKKNITQKYKRVVHQSKTSDEIPENETNKIENYLNDFKHLSPQQLSSVKYYFHNWKNVTNLMKRYCVESEKSTIKKLSKLSQQKEERIDTPREMKIEENNQFDSKDVKNNENNEKFEKKKKKKGKRFGKKDRNDDTVLVVPRDDILKYIPFCNDIVIPNRKKDR